MYGAWCYSKESREGARERSVSSKLTSDQKKGLVLLGTALSGPVVGPSIPTVAMAGSALTAMVLAACTNPLQDEVDKLKKENEDLKSQKGALEAERDTATSAKAGLEAKVAALDGQIEANNASITTLTGQIETITLQIETITTERDTARAELDAKTDELVAKVEELGLANDEIGALKTEKTGLNTQLEAKAEELKTAKAAAETDAAAIESLTMEKEAAAAALDAVTAKLIEALVTASQPAVDTNDARIKALLDEIKRLAGQVASVTAQLETRTNERNAARTERDSARDDKATAEAARDAALATVASKEAQIAFMNRQIGLMAAGGKFRDATWFAKSDAIVANAANIGSELATVFLGDGLILEALATLDTDSNGTASETEIKTGMTNIPTARVHVAAIDGATVEEIKWGIANGWLPTKTAYTIVHAGRAEVAEHPELSGATQAASETIGKKIGSIYPVLKSKTQEQAGNTSSVIFAGIIPDAASNVHSDNVSYINGNNGIKSGELGTDFNNGSNSYVKVIAPTDINSFKLVTNNIINVMNTNVVAMLKSPNVFPENKKMDYKYYMAQANRQARVAFNNQRLV